MIKAFYIGKWLVRFHWAKSWSDKVTITNQHGYVTHLFIAITRTLSKTDDVTPIYRLILWRFMIEVGGKV